MTTSKNVFLVLVYDMNRRDRQTKDGVVILGILYCSLGWYERHTSVRQRRWWAVKYLSTLRVSWKYMSKLRWQRKFSALLDWFLLSGIVLVAFCSLLKKSLFSVAVAAADLYSSQSQYASRAPPVPTHQPICLSSLLHTKEVCVPSQNPKDTATYRQWDSLGRVPSGSDIIVIFIRQKRQHGRKRKWNNKIWKRNACKTTHNYSWHFARAQTSSKIVTTWYC